MRKILRSRLDFVRWACKFTKKNVVYSNIKFGIGAIMVTTGFIIQDWCHENYWANGKETPIDVKWGTNILIAVGAFLMVLSAIMLETHCQGEGCT